MGGAAQRKAARTGPLHCRAGGAFMSEEVPRSMRLETTDIKGPWQSVTSMVMPALLDEGGGTVMRHMPPP